MPCSRSMAVSVVSETTVFPETKSRMEDLKLSVSDLPMLSCHYIQKGCLFTRPHHGHDDHDHIKAGLSRSLSRFPPLAGRLCTDGRGHVFLRCNDEGALLVQASAPGVELRHILGTTRVPSELLRRLFPFESAVSYSGHWRAVLAVQVTALADGLFVSCAVNHAVADGTSFWNFFNTFAECCNRGGGGVGPISRPAPAFSRDTVLVSPTAVLKLPEGGPSVTFSNDKPIAERIFSFSREAVRALKDRANNRTMVNNEIAGKRIHDHYKSSRRRDEIEIEEEMLSSFQAVCALLWGAVTRARKLPASKKTTFRMAVNCRHRLSPKMDEFYFGNAIQSVPTYAAAGEVVSRGLRWCAQQLNGSVRAHKDEAVRGMVGQWEREPRCFPLGNPDGASITMGSSPRFPMFDNDFGWGRPLAVRSGPANKFDGKISAFPGRDGFGTVDLEVVLSSDTMDALESDSHFMHYVSDHC